MSTHTKLILHRSALPSTVTSNWALYTKGSGTFENTESSMYAEVISLASTTGYGGASLSNQTERYLFAYAHKTDSLTSSTISHWGDGTHSIDTWLNTYASSSTTFTFTPNNETFSTIQSSLEDDGKYFFTVTDGGSDEYYGLIVDKTSLGSGSSSSSGTSLTSWAYSSQSATDPEILIDWTTPTPDYSITEDSTDWKADILAKVTAKSLDINSLIADYLLEDSVRTLNQKITLKDYLTYKIN